MLLCLLISGPSGAPCKRSFADACSFFPQTNVACGVSGVLTCLVLPPPPSLPSNAPKQDLPIRGPSGRGVPSDFRPSLLHKYIQSLAFLPAYLCTPKISPLRLHNKDCTRKIAQERLPARIAQQRLQPKECTPKIAQHGTPKIAHQRRTVKIGQRRLHNTDSTKLAQQRLHNKACIETLFGVHAQVSFVCIFGPAAKHSKRCWELKGVAQKIALLSPHTQDISNT